VLTCRRRKGVKWNAKEAWEPLGTVALKTVTLDGSCRQGGRGRDTGLLSRLSEQPKVNHTYVTSLSAFRA